MTITVTTEEAEIFAAKCSVLGMANSAAGLRSLAAERDALQAEVERLKAGGCARDQGTTQFCAEAVTLKAENARLREALDFYACVDHYQIHNAAAPNVVQFDRGAKARAALGEKE